MRKILLVIITIILLLFVGGCQGYQEVQTAGETSLIKNSLPKTTFPIHTSKEKREGPLMLVSIVKQEKFEITPSAKIKDWQKINAQVLLNEIGHYRDHKLISQLKEEQLIRFSIHVPGDWILQNTVLNDHINQKKMAELFPVVLLKLDEESDFLNFETYKASELISKDTVSFNDYSGQRLILKVSEKDTWYSYNYYLTDGTYGFGISLYSYCDQTNNEAQKLFDDIVSTLSIEMEPMQKKM